MLPRITLPPNNAALAGLAALFIVPGLANHDLWKTQDAIGLGIVHAMATSGDLLVPSIAGERWLYDQPLYHWVALAFGAALGLAFLAATWIAPASLAAAVVSAHFACPDWRTRRAAAFLGIALVVALVVGASWPLALALRAPEGFAEWRTILFSREAPTSVNLRHFVATMSWFAWPAWPLA